MLASGTIDPAWPADGRALRIAPDTQGFPKIVGDEAGGAIVTWTDFNSSDGDADIYAQRVHANGELGGGVVSVPGEARAAFALDPVRPNPSRGTALTAQFSLPAGGRASLELLDVVGRRIDSRDVGSLGPGHHSIALARHRPLAPGLYLIRLRQGSNVRVTRVAVLK